MGAGLSPQAILVVALLAIGWMLGEQAVEGVKWLGHEAKRGGAAIVHVLKKIPHPHHDKAAR